MALADHHAATQDITMAKADRDRRQGKSRLSLLIRIAKLVSEHGEFLCIVRDVSEGGVRLRFFHPVPDAATMRLVLANGDAIPVEKAWERGGQVGFRFAGKVDVQGFIAEAGRYPKRQLRIEADCAATLTADGEASAAVIRNISREGARIDCESPLALGQQVRVDADGWPPILATVCWRSRPAYGLIFRQVFTIEDLAQRSAATQLGAAYVAQWPDEPAEAVRTA